VPGVYNFVCYFFIKAWSRSLVSVFESHLCHAPSMHLKHVYICMYTLFFLIAQYKTFPDPLFLTRLSADSSGMLYLLYLLYFTSAPRSCQRTNFTAN
jgi:hypothetical protein